MITYYKKETREIKNGVAQDLIEASCGTVSEMQTIENVIDGSIVWVIEAKAFYGFSNDAWHLQ